MTKKILIVGGNGFLGINIAKGLKSKKYTPILLCRKKNKKRELKNFKYLYCNIKNFSKLKKVLNIDFECVINLSGNIDHNNKNQVFDTHYQGLKNIIDIFAKKNIKLFIQSGSCLEYGRKSSPQIEKSTCKPISYYGKAKYLASKYILRKKLNFNYIILRMYQVYGPYQKKDRLVPITINSCLNKKKFNCTLGLQKRDFLHVDDLVKLIIKIVRKKKLQSGIYNVGYGKPISVKTVINKIKQITGKGKPIFGGIKMRKDEIKFLYPNINKVRKTFNWRPKINILKGLNKTIKFYAKQSF